MYQIEIEDEKPAFWGESASGFQVHYTQKDDALYAIFLDWPGQVTAVNLVAVTPASLGDRTIRKTTLLSVKKNYDCPFTQQTDGLRLTIPQNGRYPSDAAQVVRLELE